MGKPEGNPTVAAVIDLDANATTAVLPEVLESMLPWMTGCHWNPSASHRGGREARKAIERAREQVAALIGADPGEIVFTSGGTEGNNSVLKWLARWAGRKTSTVITSAIEHSAVLRPCAAFAEVGYRVVHCGVDSGGRLDLDAFRAACAQAREGGGFASVMWANNETGVVQPVAEACAIAREHGLPFHSDAVQAAGKWPVDARAVEADYLTVSAHKFHGPKGVGALFLRSGTRFEPLLRGGGQEQGRRSGTENVPGIVGMGTAAEVMRKRLEADGHAAMRALRDCFEAEVLGRLGGVTRNGDPAWRLPNTSHLSFDGCDSAGLLILLDQAGVACSSGSACMSGKTEPSHAQLAMGIPPQRARSSLRFSFSILNTAEEAEQAAKAVQKTVVRLRSVQGPGIGPVTVYSG